MSAIYFHIPFCKRICAYCDFPKTADLRRAADVTGAMHLELEESRGFLTDRDVRTLYFGGGTPSVLHPSQLQRLADTASGIYGFTHTDEMTVEVNPDDVDKNYVAALRTTDADRVSVGIQSFDDRVLRFMNRRHTADEAADAVKRLQDAGYENITIDLIFGVEGFGDEVLRRSLEEALSLGVTHVSAYHLTVEPSTRFGRMAARGELRCVDEEQSEREFLMIHNTLTAAGFEHYEVSNFALEGFRARHNSAYWHGVQYLGIGPGAHSFNGHSRRWCSQRPEEYAAARHYESEELSERDRFNEKVMTALRCAEGLDTKEVAALFGRERAERLLAEAERISPLGVVVEEGRIRILPERMLVSDAVIGRMFEV